jgi:hypothetical protein
MDSIDSGEYGQTSLGTYLDPLSSVMQQMSLRERSDLIFLDRCLHEQWRLGQNVILNWCPEPRGIGLLVIPHYLVAEFSERLRGPTAPNVVDGTPFRGPSERFLKDLLSRERRLTTQQMHKVARLLGVQKTVVPVKMGIAETSVYVQVIESMIRRYSINYVPYRAVALFDIVGFSLLSPFEQMNQLNSLSYSLNAAQSKLLSKKIDINFARSTTGDGFYIWNRDLSLEANINLYHFMHLVLADNAIARGKAKHPTVPRLRACFHVGSCYEFYQSEGLSPTLYNYIVGDVTVDLARMIERALPEQVLVGDFSVELQCEATGSADQIATNSIDFVDLAKDRLAQLKGLELSGERVEAIKCYLTGARLANGRYSVRRIAFNDKHGISRNVYNAKVNIYRKNAGPILLGVEDHVLERRETAGQTPPPKEVVG